MSKKKYKRRLFLLCLGSFIVSVLPLAICILVNWDRYTETTGETVKLLFGGVLAGTFLFLKIVGKLKMPGRIVFFALVFIMSYLLEAVLDDLFLLSGMALLGEVLDRIFFQRAIVSTKEKIAIGKTADATAVQVEEVIKKYAGRL